MKRAKASEKLDRLQRVAVADLLSTSDDELRREVSDEGMNIDELAQRVRGCAQDVIAKHLHPRRDSVVGGIRWTHPSVKQLAGDEDPTEVVLRLARNKVLEALDAGWEGPPFNPLKIADLMGIPVEADSSVPDARIVPFHDHVKIQFNPTQSRERLRFSIGHELAHALFPDVANEIRNRGATKRRADDWQLEMLCNLGAAEFIMPLGSLPVLSEVPGIETLMQERRRFDVSAEAYLIRITKATSRPLIMFCATPEVEEGVVQRYRVDYVVTSRTAPSSFRAGARLSAQSPLNECTAVGQTAKGCLQWPNQADVSVECVGISGYPGDIYPRIAGLIRLGSSTAVGSGISYLHGNVLTTKGDAPKVICQLVNDRARRWGGGVAKSAAKKWPIAEDAFSAWILSVPSPARLGSVHFVQVEPNRLLASLVAQHGFGESDEPRIRYAALRECFRKVATQAKARQATVDMPRLGTGAAKGLWEVIEQLIIEELVSQGVTVSVYELPPKRLGSSADLFSNA